MEYKNIDYRLLKFVIKEKFGSEKSFAEHIEMAPTMLSKKLTNKSQLNSSEIIKIKNALKLNDEDLGKYFFYVG